MGMNENKQLGQKLKQLRKEHKMTQEEVADYLHIIRQTYSHYETGRISPSYKSLMSLANLYQIPVSTFGEYIYPEDCRQSSEDSIKLNSDEWLFINYYRQLDDKEQKDIFYFIKHRAESKMSV